MFLPPLLRLNRMRPVGQVVQEMELLLLRLHHRQAKFAVNWLHLVAL